MPRRQKNTKELSHEETEKFNELIEYANYFIVGAIKLEVFKNFSDNLARADDYYDTTYDEKLCDLILDLTDKEDFDLNSFSKFIQLAMFLDDELLKEILGKKPDLLAGINQRELFNLAIELKSEMTFSTLQQHGLSTQKVEGANTISPIALAARYQSSNYLEEYASILGKTTTKALILERDRDEKDALCHAIEGRSYSKTIKFLLANGADIRYRFRENLATAIIGQHNETLAILLTRNFETIQEDELLKLSNLAKEHNNHLAQILLRGRALEGSATYQNITEKIKNSAKYQITDIHQICQEGNLENFQSLIYATRLNAKKLSEALEVFDGEGRSPLFCAIDGNCYSSLVEELLNRGADPERLVNLESRQNGDLRNNYGPLGIDALTLCIIKKEPETLGIILRHPASKDISDQTLNTCARELSNNSNLNAVVIESFFQNIRPEDLRKVGNFYREGLLKTGLKYAPEATSQKIKESFAENLDACGINRILSSALENSSLQLAVNILENFSKSELTATDHPTNNVHKTNQKSAKTMDEEKISLLEERAVGTASNPRQSYGSSSSVEMSGMTNSSQLACEKLFDLAFQKRKNDLTNQNESDSKEILILLLSKDIHPANKTKMDEDLASVGITEKDYKPNCSVICGKLCSTLSEALGFSSPKVR